MIAPTELTQNYERLNTPYDPNQLIETLFQKIQDARAFVVAGGQPYGAAMIVNVAYTLIFNTGFSRCLSRVTIQSNCQENLGAVQARFRHCPS
jgi:hypothetical protein